jgi:hypothetical protein
MDIDKQKKLTRGKGWDLVFDPTITDPPKPKPPKELKELKEQKQNFKKGGKVK